jgi:hypothetical protein
MFAFNLNSEITLFRHLLKVFRFLSIIQMPLQTTYKFNLYDITGL